MTPDELAIIITSYRAEFSSVEEWFNDFNLPSVLIEDCMLEQLMARKLIPEDAD